MIEFKFPAMDAPVSQQKFADIVALYASGDMAYRKYKAQDTFAVCNAVI